MSLLMLFTDNRLDLGGWGHIGADGYKKKRIPVAAKINRDTKKLKAFNPEAFENAGQQLASVQLAKSNAPDLPKLEQLEVALLAKINRLLEIMREDEDILIAWYLLGKY